MMSENYPHLDQRDDPRRPWKAVVAIVGAAITAALGIVPPDSTLWQVLTVASAAITAAAVFLVPNPMQTRYSDE